MANDSSILRQLASVIEDRRRNRPPNSYTTKLLDRGLDAIGAKVVEEAAEAVEAAGAPDDCRHDALTHEAADLIYHLLVLLAHGGVTLDDVEAELARRFGISGLEEKASRRK
ncbi:MAG TPA: phosphoribosyl-ATP diphosphatase [Thermoguttaceae bacterium]|nr:phosphoribosyl-ATP diphosphatase [Thermoguttaceae bacterium]